MEWSESSIQSLKAQEAKDLAIEFLEKLEAKEKGPISPGEVQIKELDFQLRLREAEIDDHRRREAHEKQVKELELQIEQEKTRCAEAESRAEKIREAHAQVIARVSDANESLSTQLERATREHNLKVERLEASFCNQREALEAETKQLEDRRDDLRGEIGTLTELESAASEVAQLQEEIERRRKESQHILSQLEEEVAAAELEKMKRTSDTKRAQELELAELEARHQKDVIQVNRQAAESILESLDMIAVGKSDWDDTQQKLQAVDERTENEDAQILAQAREELRREFNITRADPIDVTDLFYREQAAQSEIDRLHSQVDKLDAEVRRMRQHIEQEPQRIASAVEAAKTQVQNYIEQGGK